MIDYEPYLGGYEWPSESLASVVNPDTGEFEPGTIPVDSMPLQHAASALHKLVRWAHSLALDPQGEAEQEARVRKSYLGRLLARKALTIEDFELYQEHGVERTPLSNRDLARVIAKQMFEVTDSTIANVISPRDLGQLASDLAIGLSNEGFVTYRED